MPLNEWYYALVPDALRASGTNADASLTAALDELRTQMDRPRPDRRRVVALATRAADLLPTAIPATESAGRVASALDRVVAVPRGPTWDASAQVYVALTALDRSGTRLVLLSRPRAPMYELREALGFDAGHASPRGFDPDRVRHALDRLRPH
jgi:hypothetical protein